MKKMFPLATVLIFTCSLVFFSVMNYLFMHAPVLAWLSRADDQLFLDANRVHTPFLDLLMRYVSWPWLWTPLYLVLLWIFIREFGRQGIHACLFVLMLTGLTLVIDNDLIKTSVQRLAPVCDPGLLQHFPHLRIPAANCYYAFVSAQSACAFAIALFINAVLDAGYRPLKITLLAWALLISYSRIYNGLHFPGDILGSFILSAVLSCVIYRLYYLYVTCYLRRPGEQ